MNAVLCNLYLAGPMSWASYMLFLKEKTQEEKLERKNQVRGIVSNTDSCIPTSCRYTDTVPRIPAPVLFATFFPPQDATQPYPNPGLKNGLSISASPFTIFCLLLVPKPSPDEVKGSIWLSARIWCSDISIPFSNTLLMPSLEYHP